MSFLCPPLSICLWSLSKQWIFESIDYIGKYIPPTFELVSLWQGNLAILPDCSLPVSEFKTPLHSFTQAVIKWHIYFNLAPGYRQQSTQRTSGIFATTTTKKVLCNWLWVKRERTLRSLLSTFIHRRRPRFLKAVPRCMNGWPSRSWWSGYRILHVDSLCQKRKKEKKKKKNTNPEQIISEINAWMNPLEVWNKIRSKPGIHSGEQHWDHSVDFKMNYQGLLCYKDILPE